MEIAIIGAGNVGMALATAWTLAPAGHSILLGLRDAGKHGELIKTTGARTIAPADAAQEADYRPSSPLSARGPVHRARAPLEPLAMVWINPAVLRGHGRNWAFAALPRKTFSPAP